MAQRYQDTSVDLDMIERCQMHAQAAPCSFCALIQALKDGTVPPAELCPERDKRGARCGLKDAHVGLPHMRWAQPGEVPYVPGPGNSIVSWPA